MGPGDREIPGGGPAMARIRQAAARGALSHALLLTGDGDLLSLARYAAAAMQCREARPPCGTCPACQKVFRDIHPDVAVVRDEEHKAVAADLVRAVRQDVQIRPNEGARKVSIFPDCSLLTERDQDILLKVVEEGPPYAAFVFCAAAPSQVLLTLRSRCVEIALSPSGTETTPEGAEDLCRRIVRRRGAVTEWAVRMERQRIGRDELARILTWARGAFAAALALSYGHPPRDPWEGIAPWIARETGRARIVGTIALLERCGGDCALPGGAGPVLGALAAGSEAIEE